MVLPLERCRFRQLKHEDDEVAEEYRLYVGRDALIKQTKHIRTALDMVHYSLKSYLLV